MLVADYPVDDKTDVLLLMFMMMAGLPKEAVQDVYTQAITKAATDKEQVDLSNAFVAAFTQLDTREHSNKLLDTLLTALDYTITFNGCKQPEPFAKGEPPSLTSNMYNMAV